MSSVDDQIGSHSGTSTVQLSRAALRPLREVGIRIFPHPQADPEPSVGPRGASPGSREEIPRLDIAVHQSHAVARRQPTCRLGKDPERLVHLQWPLAPKPPREILALREVPDQIIKLERRIGAVVVHGHDFG